MGLHPHPVCCLTWDIPALEPRVCWMGPGLAANDPSKMSTSSQSSCRWPSPQYFYHQYLCPQDEPPLSSPSEETLKTPTDRSFSGFYEVTAFALSVGVHEILCVAFKSGVSISSSSVKLLPLSPTGLQSQRVWRLFFSMSNMRVTWSSELSHLWKNFCHIILQFVRSDHITSAPLLVSHCGYFFLSLDAGYFLAGSSLFLINSCLAVSCDFGVLVRRGELTKFFLLCHLV